MLLERDIEMGVVDGFLDDVRGGEGRIMVLEGPPGIGKTALLDELERRVRAATPGERRAVLGGAAQDAAPACRSESSTARRWSQGRSGGGSGRGRCRPSATKGSPA